MVARDGDDCHRDHRLLDKFVRFKQHIDANVSSGFSTMLGASRDAHRSPSADEDPWDAIPISHPAYLQFSEYSPRNLRDISPSTPSDLPRNYDPSIFTLDDAFEDLLAVSRGQPLPEIKQRYMQRQLLRNMFPDGEPAWFWARRLKSMGLVDDSYSAWAPLDPFRDRVQLSHWDELHKELEKRARDVWRSEKSEISNRFSPSEVLHELSEMASGMAERLEDVARAERRDPGQKRGPPDSFDELFDALQSAASTGQRTWDVFKRAIADSESATTPSCDSRTPVVVPESPSKNKVVESRDEYVDRLGYTHSKVTRKELDKDGNEISVSTRHNIYRVDKKVDVSSGSDEAIENGTSPEDSDDNAKTGWFWK
jgi:hypothetical protein